MNKKIENLIAELKEELKKEDIGYAISTFNMNTGKGISSIGGAISESGIALLNSLTSWTESMEKAECPCEVCHYLRDIFGIEQPKHQHVEMTFEELMRFMNGGNRYE